MVFLNNRIIQTRKCLIQIFNLEFTGRFIKRCRYRKNVIPFFFLMCSRSIDICMHFCIITGIKFASLDVIFLFVFFFFYRLVLIFLQHYFTLQVFTLLICCIFIDSLDMMKIIFIINEKVYFFIDLRA